MRMTEKQKAVLDGLTCQRLTADPANRKLIRSFYCAKGSGLAHYLRQWAWEEDREGSTAFYLIKNRRGEILMFFSLKCGALFDPLDETELQERINAYNEILDRIRRARSADERAEGLGLLEQIRRNHGIPLDQLESNLRDGVQYKKNTLREIRGDRAHEPNGMIVRVGETHPGIELVHFCANDDARIFWRRSGMKRPMGEVLFWWFIAPIIYNVQDVIGCKYVFLFAADLSPDRSLVNYYQIALNFEQPDDIGTSKPRYDFQCEFMCQKTNDLRTYRRYYIENFNPDPDEWI